MFVYGDYCERHYATSYRQWPLHSQPVCFLFFRFILYVIFLKLHWTFCVSKFQVKCTLIKIKSELPSTISSGQCLQVTLISWSIKYSFSCFSVGLMIDVYRDSCGKFGSSCCKVLQLVPASNFVSIHKVGYKG